MQRRIFLSLLSAAVLCTGGLLSAAVKAEKPAAEKPAKPAKAAHIQLAILLDTSGSMDGLINQARTQLWKIVNELATTRKDGQIPELRVALYEYGKNSIPREQNYLRKIVPLTDDLDKISEELFALRTNGGHEYCGAVIAAAVKELEWSKSNDDLKLIFICGNEPFTQGKVNYREACKSAISKGIIVNTIHCGPEATGIGSGWKDGALLADGSFMNINQNRQVATVRTPYDAKLATLSGGINKTFVTYGAKAQRELAKKRQVAQDQAAGKAAPAAAAQRAQFKGSSSYRIAVRDLVTEHKSGKLDLAKLKNEQLPDELKKLSPADRKKYLDAKVAERTKIQKEIAELSKQRDAYILDYRKKQAKKTGQGASLDEAVVKAVREQAAKKQFQVKKK